MKGSDALHADLVALHEGIAALDRAQDLAALRAALWAIVVAAVAAICRLERV